MFMPMTHESPEPIVYGDEAPKNRDTKQAIWRGMKKKCPECGVGSIFKGYTKIKDSCEHCGLDLTGQRADDAPPYITMMIVGHLIIPIALETKLRLDPPLELQFIVWGTIMFTMAIWLLPISKGGLIGLQWAKFMHGFGGEEEESTLDPTTSQPEETAR